MASSPEQQPEQIRNRISKRLTELGESPAWLAEHAGVERSTVSRILSGQRNPTAETLGLFAPILGSTLEELVAGTDAADRVKDAQHWVDREHHDAALRQVVAFESKANRLEESVRDLKSTVKEERDRRRAAEAARATAEDERDGAKREARRFETEACRYRDGLERAVVDVAQLKSQLRALARTSGQGANDSRAAKILAGVAAVASIASYLNSADDDDDDDNDDEGDS